MDSDEEDPHVPAPYWATLEWRRGPWPRPLPEQASLLEPMLAWARAHLVRRPAGRQMHMGEDMKFYWSAELGAHVERGKEDEYRAKLTKAAPPPKATVSAATPPPVRPRGRQYVNAQGQRVIPTGAPTMDPPLLLVPVMSSPMQAVVVSNPVHLEAAAKMTMSGAAPTYPPCLARPFSLSMPIELATYDWDAALVMFERSIHWVDEWI